MNKNPRFPQTPSAGSGSGISTVSVLLALLCIVGGVFGTIAFILVLTRGDTPTVPAIDINGRLALYDDRVQPLNGSNTWTDFEFDHNRHHAHHDWFHAPSSGVIRCKRSGTYNVYIVVQSQVLPLPVPPPTPAPSVIATATGFARTLVLAPPAGPPVSSYDQFACRPCNVWLELRGVRQIGATGPFLPIPTSLTYLAPANGPQVLDKQFLIVALAGDIIKLQMRSACRFLVLTNSSQSVSNNNTETLTSASLLIY